MRRNGLKTLMSRYSEVAIYHYNETLETLLQCTPRSQHDNEPRKVAMYLSQELTAARLVEIAEYFNQ